MKRKRKAFRSMQTARIISKSPEETYEFGLKLARSIPVPGVVLLQGALGTGKTTLTRGIAGGLGLDDPSLVSSPSFTLVNIYRGVCPIYHVDLYRLKSERDLYSIGLDEFFGKEGVTIVEWSERLLQPVNQAIEVRLEDAGDDMRVFHVCLPVLNKRTGLLSNVEKSANGNIGKRSRRAR